MAFEDAKLSTVEEIYTNYKLVVPEFQRGYAWGKDQWQALWDDALNLSRRDRVDHYTGAIMISGHDKGPSAGDTVLVDGQQRLTSISLMLQALGSKGFPIRFENNEAIQTHFDYFALGREHLATQVAEHRSFYARNLGDAFAFFEAKAKNTSDADRASIMEVLLKRFKIFVLVTQPAFNVHVAFETINNRGKPLSTLERLKNRLIYLAANSANSVLGHEAMADVHKCWKSIYSWLGRGEKLLSDDDFVRAHALGWFQHENRAEWLGSELFEREFATHGSASPEDIQLYVRSLENASVWWHHLNENRLLPSDVSHRLTTLNRTASASSRPLLLWALIRSASVDSRLAGSPTRDLQWSKPLVDLVSQAERFAVLVLLANGRQADVGEADFHRLAFALAHPGKAPFPNKLPNLVPPPGAAASVRFARDCVASLVDNRLYEAEEDDETEARADTRFPWPGYFDCDAVKSVIANRLRKRKGFYQWQLGKLIIYAWEESLRGEKGLPEKKSWDTVSWDESVEHIYPQHPHADWYISLPFNGKTAEALRMAVVNSLGNLLLLSGRRNASLSNDPYRAIESPSDKVSRYRSGSYSESQVAQVCTNWTIVQIAARGIAMMRLAQRTWDFEVVSDNERLTEWLPFLFGDQAARIHRGEYPNGKPLDGRALQPWVQKFETLRPR